MLKDTVADLLRVGLAVTERSARSRKRKSGIVVKIDRKTGLPVIQCRHPAPRGQELTPERVAEILGEF